VVDHGRKSLGRGRANWPNDVWPRIARSWDNQTLRVVRGRERRRLRTGVVAPDEGGCGDKQN
jgi:hypothetical protein